MKYIVQLLFVLFSASLLSQTNVRDIKVRNINLEELNLSQVLDPHRYTLLSVGGTWCKPCLDQKPFVASLGHQYPQYLKVVFLYYRDTPEKIKTMFGLDQEYPDYYLVDLNAVELMRVNSYPTNILVDANGNIVNNDISINDVGSLIH